MSYAANKPFQKLSLLICCFYKTFVVFYMDDAACQASATNLNTPIILLSPANGVSPDMH